MFRNFCGEFGFMKNWMSPIGLKAVSGSLMVMAFMLVLLLSRPA